jgi:hypothetical protein
MSDNNTDALAPLAELIAKNPEQKQLIKEAICIWEQIYHEQFKACCHICDKPLTTVEQQGISPYDFLHICIKHQQYRNVFQADIIRKQLGIPLRRFITLEKLMTL